MTFAPSNTKAYFVDPTVTFPEANDDRFRIVLRDSYINVASALNARIISFYPLNELQNGKQYYTLGNPQKFRQAFRKTFDIGPIATGATSTTLHNISSFVDMWVESGRCITDVIDYRPIPYSSATVVTDQIEIKINTTQIIIINGATAPNIIQSTIVLEYLKQV